MDIKAAVFRQQGSPLTLETLQLKEPGPGLVRVRMAAAGVCHSDLHVMKGELRAKLPAILGHEGAGIVEAVGEGVTSVRPGDPVVLVWVPGCGECWYCQHDQAHLCEKGDPLANAENFSAGGETVHYFLSTSAFAEYTVVPETGVVKLPPGFPLDRAALVSCGVVTGVGAALNTAQVPPGASVAVFGVGGVGLNVVQGARIAGAETIVAIDRVPAKLEAAQEFGATHQIDASDPALDLPAALRDLSGGRGVDFAFDAVGQVSLIETAYKSVRKGGSVIVVGMPPVQQKLELRALTLPLHEKAILGSFYGGASPRDYIPRLLALYEEGQLMLDELVSHRFPLSEINAAFDDLDRGALRRGLIVFDG